MLNIRALLISLFVSLVAIMMVYAYISKREKALMELATPIKVFVAVKDIPEGTRLDETLLKEELIPKKYVQPGALGELSDLRDRVVVLPVLKDTQILESMFRREEEEGIAAKIPTGMRAFSVAVTDVTAVAELIQPGDFVDVMVTVEVGSFKEGRNVSEEIITKTILENVLVLAVNRTSSRTDPLKSIRVKQKLGGSIFSEPGENKYKREKLRTLTFALTINDAQKVNLAQEIGTISVALRSRWDKGDIENIPSLNAREFLGIKKSVVPRSPPPWVEIRGAEQIIRR